MLTCKIRTASLQTRTAYLPPLMVSGNRPRSYIYLPFPLEASSCQLMEIEKGTPQTTAYRPFT